MNNIVLFASGSGSNVQNIAEFFANQSDVRIDSVLCNKPTAYVLERAKNLGIDQFVFTRDEFYNSKKVLNYLEERNVDFIVLAGFLWLIPSYLVDAFPNKIINIHPALLPKYGGKGMYGMHVHRAVVDSGDKESGITVHYVNEKYDEGNIIFQAKCPVLENDSPDDVAQKVHDLEYKHFPEVISQVLGQRL